MNQPPEPIELQHLQPHGVTHNANAGHLGPAPDPLVAGPLPASSAASSSGNGNAQMNGPKPPRFGLWKRYLEWWPELGGALLSILFLVAIVVFLAQIDGSKLDDWHLAWQVKPPTIVSTLVTLCRITLAFFIAEGVGQLKWVFFEQRPHQLSEFDKFDEATRGPWGATCFIWSVNRRALVATFGAIMATLVLAMDPFSQQVLYYASQTSDITDAVATIPSAQFYDSGALYAAFSLDNSTASFDSNPDTSSFAISNGGPQTFGLPSGPATFGSPPRTSETPGPTTFGSSRFAKRDDRMISTSQSNSNCSDTLMARAAYGGLYSSVPTPEFTCPSGNCTWPSFTTLGVCSECNNITSQIKASCNVGWGFQNNRTDYSSNEYEICWYELIGAGDLPGNASYPGPNVAPTYSGLGGDTTKFISRCGGNGNTYWPLWFTWASNVWDKSRDLLSFTSYRFPKNDNLTFRHCLLPTAHVEQCTLFWCAKTFDSSAVVLGKMDEGLSTNVRLVPFSASNSTCAGLQTLKAPQRGPGVPMQGFIREDKACPQSSEDIGPHDAFWINKNDHIMTVNMLSPMIYEREMAVDGNGATYNGHGANGGSDSAIMTALWDNHEGNLSLTLADIATAMTNHVRLTDGYVSINGTSTRADTVIKVTWYWLIYMVAMVGLSLAFFVTAVAFASEKSKVVWKSSSLAVLMHGLEDFDRADLDHRSISDMSKKAKELWAQLEADSEGSLKLVRH